jgi:hypothetical protein
MVSLEKKAQVRKTRTIKVRMVLSGGRALVRENLGEMRVLAIIMIS